jgi:hypothetical protein
MQYAAFIVYKIKHNTFNDFGHHCLILQMVYTLAKTEMIYPKKVRAKVAMDFT